MNLAFLSAILFFLTIAAILATADLARKKERARCRRVLGDYLHNVAGSPSVRRCLELLDAETIDWDAERVKRDTEARRA